MSSLLEGDAHDALLVRKKGPVAVPEIETPNLDVLVGRAGDDELVVVRDVKREDRELFGGKVSRGHREAVEEEGNAPCDRRARGRT